LHDLAISANPTMTSAWLCQRFGSRLRLFEP
jgi:hypothetical protein